jgi:hypothetical protein
MSGLMEKIPSWHLEAAADQRSVMSMQKKISFTLALERKVVGTATMMRMPQIW